MQRPRTISENLSEHSTLESFFGSTFNPAVTLEFQLRQASVRALELQRLELTLVHIVFL